MYTNIPDKKWSSTEEEIMQATYQALLEHGYPGLSIANIAEEFDKAKPTIYYHYDSKADLLVAFLEFVVDEFGPLLSFESNEDPKKNLEHAIEKLLPHKPNDEQYQFQKVLVSLRSQAVTNEAFREQFTQIDDHLATAIENIIQKGINEDVFQGVDPSQVAETILASVKGAWYTHVTTDRQNFPAVRNSLLSYIDSEVDEQVVEPRRNVPTDPKDENHFK